MVQDRAAAQIEHMTAMVNARRDQEIARLQQQQAAMGHRIEHDRTLRQTQIDQTATAAEQRRKQAELAQDMQKKVYDQMSKVGPAAGLGLGYGGYGGYGAGFGYG